MLLRFMYSLILRVNFKMIVGKCKFLLHFYPSLYKNYSFYLILMQKKKNNRDFMGKFLYDKNCSFFFFFVISIVDAHS